MDDNIQEHKEILFFKRSEGCCLPEEEKQVQKLISESKAVALELDQVEQLIMLNTKIKAIQQYDRKKGFRIVQEKISRISPKKGFLYFFTRVAAVLLLPLLISTFTLIYINRKQIQEINAVSMVEVVSAPGMISCFQLPDSSRVWLNAGSKLYYPSSFHGKDREVKLTGEGYFEVKSDREHPFYVTVGNDIKVMAYGTHFNVNAYEDYTDIEAVLEEGKVDVFVSDQSVHSLQPGERALYNKKNGDVQVERINIYEKTAWKDGKIVFRNASLDEVFRRLEKRYNIDIKFHDKAKLSDKYRCRVTFTQETLQQVFSYLEAALPIKWKISSPSQQSDSTLFKQRVDVWLSNK